MAEQIKVDVPLKWVDFVWSLEELRHKVSRDTSSDWFKLNPIEVVFLGCDTIIENDQAVQKISNIGICMENIRNKILRKPRIFYWLVSWMYGLLRTGHSSTLNMKVQSLLIKMAEVCGEDFRFYFWFNSCLADLLHNDEKAKDILISFPSHSQITRVALDAFQDRKRVEKIGALTTVPEGSGTFMLEMMVEHYSYRNIEQVWLDFRIEEILLLLKETSANIQLAVNQFLLVVEIVYSHLAGHDNDTALPLYERQNMQENMYTDNVGQRSDLSQQPIVAAVEKLFSAILALLRKCRDVISERSEVPFHLARLVVVALADSNSSDITKKLTDMKLEDMLLIFLEYSLNDGNRTQSVNILNGLLEFATSGFEMEVPKAILFGVTLPNLLSLGFGAGSEETICLLLEYGSLAYRSKNMKYLFSNSLWYIKTTSQLFESHAKKLIERNMVCRRLESLDVVSKIMDELLFVVVRSSDASMVSDFETNCRMLSHPAEMKANVITDHQEMEIIDNPANLKNSEIVTTQKLLNLLLQLACEMIKAGENLNYIYASVIPRLFQRTDHPIIPQKYTKYFPTVVTKPSTIPWKVPKEELAEKTLQLCIGCIRNAKCTTPFQICGILLPKLVKNLDMITLPDSSKLNAVLEIITMCLGKVSENSVELLLSHGLDIISSLLPQTDQPVQVNQFFHEIFHSIEKICQSTTLLFLKSSLEFFLSKEQTNRENTKTLFLHLLKRSNRNDIRNVYLLSKPWFFDERFCTLRRRFLYSLPTGNVKSKSLQAFTEIVTSIIKTEEKLLSFIDQENIQNMQNVLQTFAKPFLWELTYSIEKNCFSRTQQDEMKTRLSRLSLLLVLFPEKVVSYLSNANGEEEHWLQQLESDVPIDIISDDHIMCVLQTCCRRIDQMQVPRYQKLKDLVIGVLQDFIFSDSIPKEGNDSDNFVNPVGIEMATSFDTALIGQSSNDSEELAVQLQGRIEMLERQLASLPWNASKKTNLLSFGYHFDLWSEPVSVTVQTNGELNLEENLRQTLLSCFMEYLELLRRLGVRSVTIDGKETNAEDIFSDEFSLTELKGRRAIVVKAIDKISFQHQELRTLEKKTELLLQEENIERKIESMAEKPKKATTFCVKLNLQFFDCAMCCGPQIIGCYSPISGDHCERPLEIGYRSDSAFASIYNSEGVEIENCELLFTDHGVYMYKAYSSGHPYDTAEIWLQFFIEILDNRQLVPAIILPRHFPNRCTWQAVRRFVSPDVTGTILTADFDCSSEWRSYYDFRPECFGYGKDIVLTKGFCNRDRKTSFSYQRQISCNTSKDLASMIFEFVMDKLLEDEHLQSFRFLSKYFVMFLNELIEHGSPSPEIISDSFDYDRWMKRQGMNVDVTKDEVVTKLVDFIYENTRVYITSLDYIELLNSRLAQYLQLKTFLEKNSKATRPFNRSKSLSIKLSNLLQSCLHTVAIGDLDNSFQEELLHWIFDNEDRVWRYRGGRDGHETLKQYLGFLKPDHGNTKCFPGVVVCLRRRNEFLLDAVKIKDVVAYAVGEYVYPRDENDEDDGEGEISLSSGLGVQEHKSQNLETEYYEIVTAWVKPRFRGAQVSTSMYLKIFQLVDSNVVVFDILQNSLNKILRSSFLLRMIHSAGLTRFVVKDQRPSYNVNTEFGREQFERIVVARKFLVVTVRSLEWLGRYWSYFFVLMIAIAIGFVFNFI